MVVKYSKKYKGGRYTRKIRGGAGPPDQGGPKPVKGGPKPDKDTRKRKLTRLHSDPVGKRDPPPRVAGFKTAIKKTAEKPGPATASAMFGTPDGFEEDARRYTKRAKKSAEVAKAIQIHPNIGTGNVPRGNTPGFGPGDKVVREAINKIRDYERRIKALEQSGETRIQTLTSTMEHCKTATAYTVVGLNIVNRSYVELLAAMTRFTVDTLRGGATVVDKLLQMSGIAGGLQAIGATAYEYIGYILGMHPAFQTLIGSYISYKIGKNEDRAGPLTDAAAAAGQATSETLTKDAKIFSKNVYVKFGDVTKAMTRARKRIKEKTDRTALAGAQKVINGLLYYQGKADDDGALMAAVYLAKDASRSLAAGTHNLIFETVAPLAKKVSGMDAAEKAGVYVLGYVDSKTGAITLVKDVFNDFITYTNDIQDLKKLCIHEKNETGTALLQDPAVTYRPPRPGISRVKKTSTTGLIPPSAFVNRAAAAEAAEAAAAESSDAAAAESSGAVVPGTYTGKGKGPVKPLGGGRKTRKRRKSRRRKSRRKNSRKGGYKYKKKKSSRRRN